MYLHPTSRKILETLAGNLTQSLMLSGPDGIGFAGAIEVIKGDREVLVIKPEKKQGDKRSLDESGAILVDTIRDLRETLRSTSGERIVVIDKADSMTIQAQNAFLKLLEEPSSRLHFVLLAHRPELFLSTITSRVQTIDLKPISSTDSAKLLDTLGVTDATKRSQLLFIGEGRPALLTKLVTDEKLFTAASELVRDSRTLLTGRNYQKIVVINRYKDKRDDAIAMLANCLKLLKISKNLDKIDPILEAIKRLEQNSAIRAQLMSIMW